MPISKIKSDGINDAAITTAKLADSAVNSAKIGVDVIAAEDLAANSVTVSEISNGAVTSAKLDTNIAIAGNLTVDTNTLYVDSTNNRVGIGTAAPGMLLEVDASGGSANDIARFSGRNSGGLTFRNATSNEFIIHTATSDALIFGTNGNTDRLRIDSIGRVGIGCTPSVKLQVLNDSSTAYNPSTAAFNTILNVKNSTSGASNNALMGFTTESNGEWYIGGVQNTGNTASDFVFVSRASGARAERLRIDSSGNLLVGDSAVASGTNSTCTINSGGTINTSRAATNYQTHLSFFNPNGAVGSIITNGSSTAYNTTSDYRLKENVTADWDATTRLKQLNPVRFNFIADADTTVDGFLAHEVQDIVPEAISGTKDGMVDEEYEVTPAVDATWDEDGNVLTEAVPAVMATRSVPDYQGIDQGKLVPLLVKTIQELEARITELESR